MAEATHSICCIISALNEEKNIAKAVDDLSYAVQKSGRFSDLRFIVVNDGSSDGTGRVARDLKKDGYPVEVIDNPINYGIGKSYGIAISKVPDDVDFIYLGFGDAPNVRTDLVLFFRAVKLDAVTVAFPPDVHRLKAFWRAWLSRCFTFILNFWYGLNIYYFNGMAIYPAKILKKTPFVSRNFGVHAELLIRLKNRGLKINEVSVRQNVFRKQVSNAIKPRNIYGVLKMLFRLFASESRSHGQ